MSRQIFFFFLARSQKSLPITGLTNVLVDARANVKQQTLTVGLFQELIFSVCMCVTKK